MSAMGLPGTIAPDAGLLEIPVPAGLGTEPLPAGIALDLLDSLGPAELTEVFPVPLLAVDLDTARPEHLRALAARRPPLVLVGTGSADLPPGSDALDVLLPEVAEAAEQAAAARAAAAGSGQPGAPAGQGGAPAGDLLAELVRAVAAHPIAAVTLVGLLRMSERLAPEDGLVAESLAYSTLLAGTEFASWLAARGPRRYRPSPQPLLVHREGTRLRLVLNRPEVRNAYDTATRDALVAELRAAQVDPTLTEVVLEAAGPAFGAGGDLTQFGTTPDPAFAHLVRTSANAGAEIVRCPHLVTARIHGVCVGAGIEIPAFADQVIAAPDTMVRLPELGMGLVPGAGGTVSVTRRIGRRRTAWMVLTGAWLPAETALRWGLVDVVEEHRRPADDPA